MKKRFFAFSLAIAILAVMLSGCSAASQSTASSGGSQKALKICLISNQKSGDMGPVDAMFAGAKRVEKDFKVPVKTLECTDKTAYEENIRAMAKAGYNLIITTFPPMSEATKAVAADYPDVKFCAIFQSINEGKETYKNVWDTVYRGEQGTYILGAIAATMTKSNKIGYISGDQAASVCEACNGYMRGALSANSNIEVKFVSVGSYEDPAKAKEIANAMIADGVDVIQTDAGDSQVGVIEACKAAGIMVSGDVSDNAKMYPKGFISYLGIDFGQNVYLACKDFINGTFSGGKQGYMDISNQTYFIKTSLLQDIAQTDPEKAQKCTAAKKLADNLIEKIGKGTLTVKHDITLPNWDRIKKEG